MMNILKSVKVFRGEQAALLVRKLIREEPQRDEFMTAQQPPGTWNPSKR